MKQVLAVGVAALLIAAAIVLRDALDEDDDAGGDAALVVACATELREACRALEGVSELRVEDPAATIADAGAVDAWVTFDPWPDIAAVQRGRPLFAGEPAAVATTDLVLVHREAALPAACDADVDWACVVAAPATAAPALPSPQTALGALLLGHGAAAWSATTRPGAPFAANEFELPGFQAWLRALDFVPDPVADMLQFAPAGPVATGTTRARFDTEVATSREAAKLFADATAAPASVAVVVAGPDAERVAGQRGLRDALAALGYRVTGDPAARSTGLPPPGVLLALQELA